MTVLAKDFQENDFKVMQRSSGVSESVKAYLDQKVEEILAHRSVNHPFLAWYGENALSKEQEKQLYLETNAYFKYLPFYVANISTITRDEAVLREVLHNSTDELGTQKSHSDMFAQFLDMLDITSEDIEAYEPLESSVALNEGIKEIYNSLPLERALGALFADETQSAAMCSRYNEGLKNQGYDARTRHFWELHIEAEIGHSNAIYNILGPYVTDDEGKERFESGIAHYLQLMEKFWDNVELRVQETAAACA
ncbi:iron-containing redox enzyme family protein [Marinobacter pelagius]|uniref:Pyrroloquinoline-quinone synthase n=1 Tax=Marinobacter pelagius TaxID=379482 RepID=A0A1I4US63_9GAMM|nr:iron-containing redox enzyme family protein [Marinobacter pelagius]SFM91819.1 pyrroloquinoline-quinone synthase [Marinobacter pelagius]